MKKRIALVSAVFAPATGGMATVAVAEARALAAHADLTVFTLSDSAAHDADEIFAVHRMRAFPRFALSGFVPQLFWLLRSYDVVYAELPAYGFFLPLYAWKLFFRRRLVVTVHMDPVGVGWQKLFFCVARICYRAVLRSADAVRVSSTSLANTPLLQGLTSVHVIPFGVDARFSPAEKKWDVPPIFLFVGRLSHTHYFKGVPVLLAAFAQAGACNGKARLRIVGDGDLRAEFEAQAHALGIADQVTFCGALTDQQLVTAYQDAHVLVLPSTDRSEAFGLVILEALACGSPVIASQLPGVEALFASETIGTLVPPGDIDALSNALSSVYTDSAWWKTAAGHASTAAVRYGNWKRVAEQLIHLLY